MLCDNRVCQGLHEGDVETFVCVKYVSAVLVDIAEQIKV